jgi:hypothetical protein
MSANTGGPAFPTKQYNRNIMAFEEVGGMTLRDYFAAKAMVSILSQKDAHDGREWGSTAWMSYQIADAMLKAREV